MSSVFIPGEIFCAEVEAYVDCCYVLDLLEVKRYWRGDLNKCISVRYL